MSHSPETVVESDEVCKMLCHKQSFLALQLIGSGLKSESCLADKTYLFDRLYRYSIMTRLICQGFFIDN